MNILCLGDIVGKPGREAVEGSLAGLRKEWALDFVIINAENAAGGAGITPKIAQDILAMGCDVITLGDHVWDQKDIEEHLKETDRILRPANFPDGVPGKGYGIYTTASGIQVGVVNLLGRVFMRYHVNCPFRALDEIVAKVKAETPVVIVDIHAEATSEKTALGHHADGKVSAVVGTHTHVQTADERILNNKTAYITDLGMTGPYDSVIGQDKNNIIKRFMTSMPLKFNVAEGDVRLCGVVLTVEEKTGRAERIVRIQKPWSGRTGAK